MVFLWLDPSSWISLAGAKTTTVRIPKADMESNDVDDLETCYQLCESLKDP